MRFSFRTRRRRLFGVGAVLFIACVAAGFANAVALARRAADESSCNCRMCGYGSSLAQYYSIHRTFPPEYVDNEPGKRQSWNDLLGKVAGYSLDLACPSGAARFVAVCGPGAILDGAPPTEASFSDGCGNTVVFIELSLSELARTDGSSLRLDAIEELADADGMFPQTSIHPGGRGLVFADCTAYRQAKPIPINALRALCTKAGGEPETRESLVDAGCLVHVGWYPSIP